MHTFVQTEKQSAKKLAFERVELRCEPLIKDRVVQESPAKSKENLSFSDPSSINNAPTNE